MGASIPMDDAARAALRALPSVNEVLEDTAFAAARTEAGDARAVEAVRAELDAERASILRGGEAKDRSLLVAACARRAHRSLLGGLRPVVNATGVVIHTNLGRAPLAPAAAERVARIASGYSTLEYSLDNCSRGSRRAHAADLLRRLTGAEDALVVNNNAAAVFLVLAAHASGREVIVSRGELVEIGGSFRIPDVMTASGARLVEVGATNRTHLADYERAITPETAMILKVHPSNYRIEGFHEEVAAADLARLAREHGVLFYEDQGSGALLDDAVLRAGGEHTTPASIRAGLDIVSCSGDKLLGAAQAGIILGRAPLVRACAEHPLYRALRPGKLALAALEATLQLYLEGDEAARAGIPVLRMLDEPLEALRERAESLADEAARALAEAGMPQVADISVEEGASTPGGGSLPTMQLPTAVVALRPRGLSVDALKRDLIQVPDVPVVCRARHDALLIDVRTVLGARDERLVVDALVEVFGREVRDER